MSIKFFSKNIRSKDGFQSVCKTCHNEAAKRWAKNNPKKMRAATSAWKKRNPEKNRETVRIYRNKNIEKARMAARRWAKNNPEKANKIKLRWAKKNPKRKLEQSRRWAKNNPEKVLANVRLYQAAKLQRVPLWLTTTHKNQMKQIYMNCPKGHHVDHLYPLRGKIVSGLHVPWNLVYLKSSKNHKKGNRMPTVKELAVANKNQKSSKNIYKKGI
jgi:5-methylcytosine-specific restriction endonuclease McrA